MGAVRHIADIRADEMDQEGQGLVCLQSGNCGTKAYIIPTVDSFGSSPRV